LPIGHFLLVGWANHRHLQRQSYRTAPTQRDDKTHLPPPYLTGVPRADSR